MKSQLRGLCERFDQFEKKAIRVIAICTSLPGVIVALVAVLKFLGGFKLVGYRPHDPQRIESYP